MNNVIDIEDLTKTPRGRYQLRRAKRMHLYAVARKTVKWTLIGAGVVAIAGAVLPDKDDKTEAE